MTAWLSFLVIAGAQAAPAQTDVRVERATPRAARLPTLTFLRDNRDFLRASLDATRQRTMARGGSAGAVDPRFMAYRDLMAHATAAGDSMARAESKRRTRELLASVTELAQLETQLDQFDRTLDDQRVRLALLQRDFTGDQRTALAIVLSGYPSRVSLSSVTLALDDSTSVRIPLTETQVAALKGGGVVQVFHGYVEPREQLVRVGLPGVGDEAGDAGYVTLDPARDRLTMLKLELSQVEAGDGALGLRATTWLNDAQAP
jgi:hypothetical protein